MKSMLVPALMIVLAAAPTARGQGVPDSPYRVTHPADRVACFNPGLETWPITTCVIETDAGLVVIDTGLSPTMAARTRARIVAELERDDFRWVINTHSHFDHTSGNQVFSDALIIGHENVPDAMRSFFDGRKAWIERRHRYLDRQRDAAAGAEPDSAETQALEETLQFDLELIDDLGKGYRPTPPAVTFSDRLNLTAGDLELSLVWMGRAHTNSDVLIHVPDLGVLFTGDLFDAATLGPTFYSRPVDVGRWLVALDAVQDDDLDIVVGGHGRLFSPQWVAAQRRYLGEVQRAVHEAGMSGASPAELGDLIPLDELVTDIAEMIDAPTEDLAARHVEILEEFWRVDQISAADETDPFAGE